MKHSLLRSANAGFTLVELAVVLAIVGLLAGGVMVGRSLIERSRIASVGRDLVQYGSAIDQFRTRFRAWPGDMANAQNYWGVDPDGCPTHTNRVPKKETCNGNGDQQIYAYEGLHAWQHLADAELVNGIYTGVGGSGGPNHTVAGENIPASRIPLTAYALFSSHSGSLFPSIVDKNSIMFGKQTLSTGNNGPALSPANAYALDIKLDDGKPGLGNIQQWLNSYRANCISDDTIDATYTLTEPGLTCQILYILPNQMAR